MNSKYTSSGATRIGRSKREIKVNDESLPGPGHYRVPSDFGYIDNSKMRKKANTTFTSPVASPRNLAIPTEDI